MKVKIVVNKLDTKEEKGLINSDLSDSLQIGKSFYVFAMNIEPEGTYFYIFNDFYLFPVPSQMFEVTENDIPPQWKVKMVGKSLFLCPDLFNEPFFHDRFSEHEKELEIKFKSLALEMYPDFEYKEW